MVGDPLSDALEALLYRRSAREKFLAGDLAHFALSPEDADALTTIDPIQLRSAAKIVRDHVFQRRHRGVGSLVQAFSKTFEAWQAQHPGRELDDLACEFVESSHFAAYRTTAFAGPGTSLEEAFYRFASDASLAPAPLLLRECAMAILRGLASTPAPVFLLPAFVRRAPEGFFVIEPDGPTLFALLRGRFVEGPITPYIAALLTSTSLTPELMPSPAEQLAVQAELETLGLLAGR